MSAVKKRPISVLIVTEYFFPTIGGVELHVYKLAEYLIQFGLKVVIFTRNFGSRRVGIRYLANGIKVYHHWNVMLIPPSTSPTVFDAFPYYRSVLIRENVDIIHIHMYMRVFTMFEDNIIAVSNKHRENMVLRSYADPRKVSVIPNALVCFCLFYFYYLINLPYLHIHLNTIFMQESDDFKCNDEPLSKDKIVIVYISRLCERKGIDLLTQVVPLVCKNHDNVEFIIGGGGPKLSMLRGMVDRHYLHDRVKILGYVPRHEVNKVLRQGHIFLNTSQTESFCIALLEAASSGLILVSTSVGGIPEVLPHDIILLSEYDPVAVSNKIDEAIAMLHTIDTSNYHQRVKEMYSWESVAKRTSSFFQFFSSFHTWFGLCMSSFSRGVRLRWHQTGLKRIEKARKIK
eukprot:XP_764395.1 N-acetylglucosaminyl-phosphatidylinositol transferase [Theileria parva strain Muguga]